MLRITITLPFSFVLQIISFFQVAKIKLSRIQTLAAPNRILIEKWGKNSPRCTDQDCTNNICSGFSFLSVSITRFISDLITVNFSLASKFRDKGGGRRATGISIYHRGCKKDYIVSHSLSRACSLAHLLCSYALTIAPVYVVHNGQMQLKHTDHHYWYYRYHYY